MRGALNVNLICFTGHNNALKNDETKKKTVYFQDSLFNLMLVGVQGFEPWTPWSQTRCATGLRYTPKTAIIDSNPISVNNYLPKAQLLSHKPVITLLFAHNFA